MRYTACAYSLRNPRNSTRCEPCAPREARSVALPARSARSAPITPTLKVTSSRSCQRMVETSKPARSLRTSTTSLPLVAAISSRRCDSANSRRWIAQASRVSPGINTERRSASGLSRPAPSIAVASLIEHPFGAASFLLGDLGAKFPQFRLDGARVCRTHADQQLLSGRTALEVGVGVFVEHLGLHQPDRR